MCCASLTQGELGAVPKEWLVALEHDHSRLRAYASSPAVTFSLRVLMLSSFAFLLF
eukprot:COSAG05_NODE_29_length_29038_cov_1237.466985_21_plen_56_part_00